MIRRVPLWLTMVPLVVAVGLYGLLWSGWAQEFRETIATWLPAAQIEISGFPYRLEADVPNPALAGGTTVKLSATASRVRINRGPWQPELTVVAAENPAFRAIVGPLLSAGITGKSALTSIHVVAGRLLRFSSVVEAARLRFGMTAMPIAADSLELHLRETAPGLAAPTSATPPVRGQLIVNGQRLRLGNGDALTLAAEIAVTGAARLTNYDGWAGTGTAEIVRLTLADASGEIASASATLVPQGRIGLRYAGTVETVCPLAVAAVFAGGAAPPEKRLRLPLRLAFEGSAGTVKLSGIPDNLAARPTRAQLPACPVMRGQRG